MLNRGDDTLVEIISKIIIEGRNHYYYSFATKYCSFHRPDSYPIFDSRVKEYLWQLRNKGGLPRFQQQVLWNYPVLKRIIVRLKEQYSLQDFSTNRSTHFFTLKAGSCSRPKR
jgi:hypothetical protein